MSYTKVAEFKVTQTPPSLSLSKDSVETDYASKILSVTCTIMNPVAGILLTATSDEAWITNIQVKDNTVSYNISENNSGASRTGKIKLVYGIEAMDYTVTQTYTAPVVTLTPSSQSTDYKSKTLAFTYSVDTPRQGVTASASSTDTWITDIKVSGNTVSYMVTNNYTKASRTGKIMLVYAGVTTEFSVSQNFGSAQEPLCCEWSLSIDQMDIYKDLFGGTAGVTSQEKGFGFLNDGKTYFHVPSTIKEGGNIYYYQVDKTGMTPTNGNPKRIIGATGDAYVTGAWPGDYWLITASDGYEYPAGTLVNVNYLTRVSGTGHKYQILEYWDGQAWQPAMPLMTENETGSNAKYNFVETTTNEEVDVTYKLAVPCSLLQFRMRCAANWQQSGNGALANPNGGTIRISERCKMQVIQ